MTLMEPIKNVILRGHYCKIEIGAGNKISKLIITGFNNKLFLKQEILTLISIEYLEILK